MYFLGLVDHEDGPEEGGFDMSHPPLAQDAGTGPGCAARAERRRDRQLTVEVGEPL